MTSENYKTRRELSGTQTEVATLLGVTRQVGDCLSIVLAAIAITKGQP